MTKLMEILKVGLSIWVCYVVLIFSVACYVLYKIFRSLNW